LIAKDLDVSNQDVIDMNRRLAGDKSINVPLGEDGEAGEWQDRLVDQSPSPETMVVEQDEKNHQRRALIAAIDVLNDRERRIFEARLMADDPPTLEDLALKFKVSPERVRQIETMAFEKVRKAAKNISRGFAGALDDVVECGSPNLNRTAQCLPTGG
jgi:RNA polymerase sigma-32 factor